MAISYRLHSSMDIRPDNNMEEMPKKVVFLSVEGNTEKNYFDFIDKYRKEIGIESLVHIETLSKLSKDGQSDPEQVFDLLNECLQIRDEGILPQDIFAALKDNVPNYSIDYITKYLSGQLPDNDAKKLFNDIKMAGIDLNYQKFLSNYKGEDGNDVFAIVIDRDCQNHSEEMLKNLLARCKEKKCLFFLTNPCFEFWLLLHVSDVKNEYSDQLAEIQENKKISNRHTFVSSKLSEKAHHAKKITHRKFEKSYLPNIDLAIERSKQFSQDENELMNKLGSNMPELFSILRK